MAVLALLVTLLAGYGARDLHVDADVVGALAGNSEGYLAYEAFQERFALGRADEAVLIRADDLADPAAFEALENLILDLQFAPPVAEVVSLFTLPAEGSTTPMILANPDAPLVERFAALQQAGPAAGALVSEDRTAALLHVIARNDAAPGDIYTELEALNDPSSPISAMAVGQAAVERQISFALIRDQVVVTPLAILICMLVGALILRSIPAVLVCAIPSICGVVWFMGILGWSGQALDPWLATLPTLVMVLAFADTLHLFYASRDAGGVRAAIREVLPAAAMTTLTSALALASFAIGGTDALMGLAIWGPVSMVCAFAAVAILFPLLARLLIRERTTRPAQFTALLGPAHGALRRYRLVATLAAISLVALLPTINQAEPSFSLSEHIRDTSPLGQDMAFMEAEGLGSASLFVEIADADAEPGLSEADGARINAVADVVLSGTGNAGTDGPPQIPDRFRAADGLSIALPVLLPLGAAPEQFGAEIDRLRAELDAADLTEVTRLSGQSLLAHEVVPETVAAMRASFYLALIAIAIVVAISQRSALLAALATLISAMPMLAIEAVLVLTGQGMTMTAAFALTVAFGIAVDDTIHYLNRWRHSDGDAATRLNAALVQAGPPMIASTLIMTLGFGATIFSATASLPIFGAFVILALWMALLADLGFLPSLIRMVTR